MGRSRSGPFAEISSSTRHLFSAMAMPNEFKTQALSFVVLAFGIACIVAILGRRARRMTH